MQTRILLVDDHRMIRQGLRTLLTEQSDFAVVGEADEGCAAVRVIETLRPDVVVMDIRMPDLNGIEATRQILAIDGNIKIVGLSALQDPRLASEMFQAGARGYVVKGAAFEELVQAIRTVISGQTYISPAMAGSVVLDGNGGGHPANYTSAFHALSPREREALQLIAEGKSTKEVAACLEVSVKTVETHRRNLMEKLGIDSVAELTKFAIREGITSP